MSAIVPVLRADARPCLTRAFAALAGTAAVVAVATFTDQLVLAAMLATVGVLAAVSVRWPLFPLFLFAAVIPLDEIARIGPLGSPGRIVAIAFVLVYAVPRLQSIRLDPMPLATWGYLGWAALSAGWALDPGRTVAEFGTLLQMVALAVLVADAVIEHPAIVRPLLWVYSAAAAATALFGVIASLASGGSVMGRASAFSGQDPAQFAAILLPAFAVALYEILRGPMRLPGTALAVASAAGIVLSGARGAWVAAVVVAAGLILATFRLRKASTVAVTLAGIGAAALALLSVPGLPAFVASRIDLALVTGGAGRTSIWTVGASIFGASPLIGVGFDNFPIAFTSERIRLAGVPDLTLVGSGPHDIIVGTAAELGLVGLVLLALLIAPLFARAPGRRELVVVQAALVSLLVDALFLDIFSNRKQVWLLVGIAAGLLWSHRHAIAPAPRRWPVPEQRLRPAWPQRPALSNGGASGARRVP